MNVRASVTRPSPRQSEHGLEITSPFPPQRRHGTAVTTWPRIDWRTRCNSPAPWHSGHRMAVVPALAPVPWHVVQPTGVSSVSSRDVPNTASLKVELEDDLGVVTADRASPAPRSAGRATEEGVEQVPEPAPEEVTRARHGAVDALGTEAVVAGPPFGSRSTS